MQRRLPAKSRVAAVVFLFLVASAVLWWGLGHLEPRIDWLRVEAPGSAVVGHSLRMRVHVAPVEGTNYVCVDLHGSVRRDAPARFLVGGGCKPTSKEGSHYDFDIMVPPREGLRFVSGVIFLSATGRWEDHAQVVGTERIPVTRNADIRLRPLGLVLYSDSPRATSRPNALFRWLTGLLLLTATVVVWQVRRPSEAYRWGLGKQAWRLLAVLLALACLWELCGMGALLGTRARALARAADVYALRSGVQKAAISVTVVATVLFLICARRARGPARWLLTAFGLYVGFGVVSMASLHEIDKVVGFSWHGLSLIRALSLVCAAMVLWLALRCRNQAGN